MAKRIFTVCFLSFLSLGYLSIELPSQGGRRLASCADSITEPTILPLPSGLFGQVKDEALRKATMDYYIFLSKVEMQALAGRQSVRAMYGLGDSAPLSAIPAPAPFDPRANAFATGSWWGHFEGGQANGVFTAATGTNIPPIVAGSAPTGTKFAPYRANVDQRFTVAPTAGTFLPSVKAANHRIGTF